METEKLVCTLSVYYQTSYPRIRLQTISSSLLVPLLVEKRHRRFTNPSLFGTLITTESISVASTFSLPTLREASCFGSTIWESTSKKTCDFVTAGDVKGAAPRRRLHLTSSQRIQSPHACRPRWWTVSRSQAIDERTTNGPRCGREEWRSDDRSRRWRSAESSAERDTQHDPRSRLPSF